MIISISGMNLYIKISHFYVSIVPQSEKKKRNWSASANIVSSATDCNNEPLPNSKNKSQQQQLEILLFEFQSFDLVYEMSVFSFSNSAL